MSGVTRFDAACEISRMWKRSALNESTDSDWHMNLKWTIVTQVMLF